MAQNLTNYAESALIQGTAMPTTFYVKAHIGDPTEAATASPAAETTRKQMILTAPDSSNAAFNTLDLVWTALANAEIWSHLTLWDHVSAGNPWWYGPTDQLYPISIGHNVVIRAGLIRLQFS